MAESPALIPAAGLLIRQSAVHSAVEELQVSVALLRRVASGDLPDERVLRLYTPGPTLALTRRESRMPGFAAARAGAEARGFEVAIRPTGGRAVAYDPSCLVFDLVCRDDGSAGQDEFSPARGIPSRGRCARSGSTRASATCRASTVPERSASTRAARSSSSARRSARCAARAC